MCHTRVCGATGVVLLPEAVDLILANDTRFEILLQALLRFCTFGKQCNTTEKPESKQIQAEFSRTQRHKKAQRSITAAVWGSFFSQSEP